MIIEVNSTKLLRNKSFQPKLPREQKKKELFSNLYKASVTLMPKSDKIVNKEK